MTATISILPEEAQWRSRTVRYYAGDWEAIQTVMPQFDLVPFAAGQDEPANPFLQTVMRRPLSAAERPIPIGIVSHTYSLAAHREVAALCRKGLTDTGIDPGSLRYEIGMSELGEWMNFRIYLDDFYSFTHALGEKLDLRLECFNSVDGSSRLVILFGWLRLVCANGLVIGETKIEIKERHGQSLDLASVPKRIRAALEAVEADRSRMTKWQAEKISVSDIAPWADADLSEKWGKRPPRACFTFAIPAKISKSRIHSRQVPRPRSQLDTLAACQVPPERAATKYDVSQALSFVASHRNNTEERVARQADIPFLLDHLIRSTAARAE